MDTTILIMTAVLVLTVAAPFAVMYAIKFAVKGDFEKHKKYQTIVFTICVLGVLALEGLIRVSGGSGSLAGKSPHAGTVLFKSILYPHIAGAILTYILWIYQIVSSYVQFGKKLPGQISKGHKVLGKIVLIGLFYTAITALAVYVLTLGLV